MRLLCAGLFLCAAMVAETPVQHLLETKMFERISRLDARLEGVLGVAALDLTGGRLFVYNAEAIFPAASSIKIPILVAMFNTVKDLDAKVTLQPDEAVAGSGTLQNDLKNGPVTLTLRELITAMIEHSDNTATNRCISMVGMDRVNAMLRQRGLRVTRLRRKMMDGAAAARGDENVTSPAEMARFVEMLYRGQLADAAKTEAMIGILKLVKAEMRRSIPKEVEVASKPGDLPGVHCEAGIVYLKDRPFILSVYSTFMGSSDNKVGHVTRIVFEYFQKLAQSNEYGNKVR